MGGIVASLILLFSFLYVSPSFAEYRSTLLPKLTITQEYTDNVFLSADDKQSDFLTVVSPGITYSLTGKHKELSISYDAAFPYYMERENDFNLRHAATVSTSSQISKFSSLQITDSFLRTDDPAPLEEARVERGEDPSPIEDPTVRKRREPYYSNSGSVRWNYEFGPSDSLYVDYANTLLRSDDPELEDSTSHTPSLGVTYWFTPLYGIEAGAAYTRGDFSGETEGLNDWNGNLRFLRKFTQHLNGFVQYTHTYIDLEGGGEDYQVLDGSAGVDYALSETTFFTASAGYFYRDPRESKATSGYSLNGDMAKRFQHGSIRLSGGTGYQQTFFGAENLGFTEYKRASVNAIYEFSRRINFNLVGAYQINNYIDVADREDNLFTLGGGLVYTFRPWLVTTLSLSHRKLDSSDDANDYDENRVTLTLSFVPRPIRLH